MAEFLGFIITMAQLAGGYAIYAMFNGEFYKLPFVLIVLGALCAWCLICCILFLLLSLVQFYKHLDAEDAVAHSFMHSSPSGSFAADLKMSALWLEGMVFMFAITPGEHRRAKNGFR